MAAPVGWLAGWQVAKGYLLNKLAVRAHRREASPVTKHTNGGPHQSQFWLLRALAMATVHRDDTCEALRECDQLGCELQLAQLHLPSPFPLHWPAHCKCEESQDNEKKLKYTRALAITRPICSAVQAEVGIACAFGDLASCSSGRPVVR